MLFFVFFASFGFSGAKISKIDCKKNSCSVHLNNMFLSYETYSKQLVKVTLSAKTTGWVAIGFGAGYKMKGAHIVIAYVDKGKVHLSYEYGYTSVSHKAVAQPKTIHALSGAIKEGWTTVSFTMPLKLNGETQTFSQVKKSAVILAYGENGAKNFASYHAFRTYLVVPPFKKEDKK